LPASERYSRQVRFEPIGEAGQERLAGSRVGVVGVGALGSVVAEQLVRAGVGHIRIVDRDCVEVSNLQRQTLFEEEDARQGIPKAVAAERRLRRINSEVTIESTVDDLNSANVEQWISGLDLIVDGLDNFETRFVLNDASRKAGVPWIYGAAVGSYGLVLPVIPQGPCLRCALGRLPSPGSSPTCDTAGVIAPITAIIASLQMSWAMRILTGSVSEQDIRLTTADAWSFRFRSVRLEWDAACPLCAEGRTEYLEAGPLRSVTLCGRNAVQLIPDSGAELDLAALGRSLETFGPVQTNEFVLRCSNPPYELTLFRDGRAIIRGTEEAAVARSLYSKMVGN